VKKTAVKQNSTVPVENGRVII